MYYNGNTMNIKMLKAALAGLVLSVSGFANAGLITGEQYTDDGKLVELSQLEWLTWDETINLSRDDIENGINNTFIADGWRYATRSEFEALFDSLWGGTLEGWQSSNKDGAIWLNANLDLSSSSWQDIAFGTSAECSGASCWAHYNSSNTQGWFSDSYGLSVGSDNINTQTTTYRSVSASDVYISSALVRSSSVPEPSTLAIFALGIMGLASRRFKKQ